MRNAILKSSDTTQTDPHLSFLGFLFSLSRTSPGNKQQPAPSSHPQPLTRDTKLDSTAETRSRATVAEGGSGEIGVSSGEEELDLGAPVDYRVSGNERSMEVMGGVCMESDGGEGGGVDKDMDSSSDSVAKGEDEEASGADRIGYEKPHFDVQNDRLDDRSGAQNELFDAKFEAAVEQRTLGRSVGAEKHAGFQFKSVLSEFDDYVASEKNGIGVGMSRAISFGFDVGDMVWGKVKSHPWWPGHIFNEAFATASVRHTRREGLVLVAFFGDSSYGWFDPAELVPFDPNFAEKSQQTNSRTFVRAVEEALDELSRRRGLGLTCKCRNPYNFRPSKVQDYYAVDVPDYERGGVYSETQIRKARDGFHPSKTLDFIKQLAVAPHGSDQKSIEYIKNKATVFAYRKAVFEEFDETYAQAFGVQGARASRDVAAASEQPVKMPRLAPFSGPLVFAETLGGGKSSVKPPKVKDHSKKDRYLFKRRESNSKVHQVQASSPSSLVYMEGSAGLASGDFVLQKRTPDISIKPDIPANFEQSMSISMYDALSGQGVSDKMDQTPGHSTTNETPEASLDTKPSLDTKKVPSELDSDLVMEASITSWTTPGVKDGGLQPSQQEGKAAIDSKHEESVGISVSNEGHQQPEPRVEGGHGVDQVHGALTAVHSLPADAKRVVKAKKTKVVKLPVGDSGSDGSVLGVKKKKKKKRELGSQASMEPPQKRLATAKGGPSVRKLPGKSTLVGLDRKEGPHPDHQMKDGTNNSISASVWTLLMGGELVVPQLLIDLQALALNPFHGVERNSPTIIKEFFGRFRSDAFQKSQKSLAPAQVAETGGSEGRLSKSAGSEDVSDTVVEASETSGGLPPKPVKAPMRPNDPTKAGRKRGPSDRQEENTAKKVKRINDLKSMAAEKKASLKTPEAQRGESRKTGAPAAGSASSAPASAPTKSARAEARRVGSPEKAADPTMLVMKFPPQTSLPSIAELKARFARFGPLDHNAMRVFWKTSMCRVVFRHKRDAQNALKFAAANNSLFGNVNVRYHIREIGTEPAVDASESGKGGRGDDTSSETARIGRLGLGRGEQPAAAAVQLKSILKKSSGGDEVAGSNSSRGTARVKFMLGGEEASSSGGGQAAKNIYSSSSNNNNNGGGGDGDGNGSGVTSSTSTTTTTTTTVATMDFNGMNFEKPSALPIIHHNLPHHQFGNNSHNDLYHHHHTELVVEPPRKGGNVAAAAACVDISQQMLRLLTRCNDVVSNVSSFLGYVPYHPL